MSLSKRNDGVSVYAEVRLGAKVIDALKNCTRDCSNEWGPQDHVVIMNGANDTSGNETKNCINM
jgi:hypothetical protein